MEKQAYMTAAGAWAGNWYDGTLAPAALIPAPAGGRYGWRWDGAAWAEDDGAEAEVEAVLQPPEQRLAADRAGMVADVWQLRAALDLTDPNLWPMIEGVPPCDPVSRAAIPGSRWAAAVGNVPKRSRVRPSRCSSRGRRRRGTWTAGRSTWSSSAARQAASPAPCAQPVAERRPRP